MAIITKNNVQKGAEVEFILNIPELLQHESVVADPYFTTQNNWDKVVLSYASVPGLQRETLIFSNVDSGNTSTSFFGVSAEARDSFFIKSISIIDKQGGFLIIKRTRLNTSDFDVHFATPAVFTGFDSAVSLNDAEINILTEIQSDMLDINTRLTGIEEELDIVDSNRSLTLNNDSQIALSAFTKKQFITVQGNAGPVVLNLLPFVNMPPNGAEVILMGASDASTVRLKFNDVENGAYINGDAILGRGKTITLIYNQSLLRFVEKTRSF